MAQQEAQYDARFDAWVQDKMSGHTVAAPEPSAALFGIVPDAPVAVGALSQVTRYALAAAAVVKRLYHQGVLRHAMRSTGHVCPNKKHGECIALMFNGISEMPKFE